jgi:exopolysaccharide biosynthesis polyprenyl glycosylphosphotransferase
MRPARWRIIKQLAKIFDVVTVVSSFILAVALCSDKGGVTVAGFLEMRIKLSNCLLFVMLVAAWQGIFGICGLYISKRLSKPTAQIMEIAKATTLATIFLAVCTKVFHLAIVSYSVILLFWLFSACAMIAGRLVTKAFLLRLRSQGRNRRFILIIGTNERAIEFAHQILDHPELGYQIVGFVDDDWQGIQAFEASGYRRCSSFSGLADFLRHSVVDEAAIYLPLRSYYEHAAELVSLCEQHGIMIRFDSQVFSLRGSSPRTSDLADASHVLTASSYSDIAPALTKRIVDFCASFSLLVLLSPLFAAIAALVKLTSDGPIFFSQARVGLNKRQFRIHKFRTMVANAEQMQDQLLAMNEMSGPVFKIQKDPRVTPLGRILRKTSIDELPQLFNVLKGDMSLVGPRPLSFRDYGLFDQDWQRRRFSVKPGITCLWQIYGRNSVPFEEWMELDMQYIDKWSLWLDFKILARTVPAVLRGTGAA